MNNLSADEARSALRDLDQSRAALASISAAPFRRHAAFALVMALLVLSVGAKALLPLFALSMLGVVLIVQWDRREFGAFVNGWRSGPTLPVSIVLLLLQLACVFFALWGRRQGVIWPGALASGVSFLIALGCSYWWERVYLRELGR